VNAKDTEILLGKLEAAIREGLEDVRRNRTRD